MSAFPISNHPVWDPAAAHPGTGHQEVWYLKMNDPSAGRALWLRFTLLIGATGQKRVAEVWAISFEKQASGEVTKVGLKNTYGLDAFTPIMDADVPAFRIGECSFSDHHTRGEVRSDDHTVRWDFEMKTASPCTFDFVPTSLRRLGLVKTMAVTVFEDWRFTGWSEVDGAHAAWNDAPGMQGHLAGPKNGHSWAWGHCNCFVDEEGRPAPCIFDGLSARARLGKSMATPHLTTLYFHYRDTDYCFNRPRDALRTKSRYGPLEWEFETGVGRLLFRGQIRAELGDFAGVTYEDTDGSFLYCYNSKVSNMTMRVYRGGTLEQTLTAAGTTAFEFVTREKHPDIPLLI